MSARPEHFFLERYMRAYAAEWGAFVDALVAGAPMPVTLIDGVNALAIAEAAIQSLRTGATTSISGILRES